MPYIHPDRRGALNWPLPVAKTAGELNYLLTKLVLAYMGNAPTYQVYNGAVGALECCKLELYRRKVVPYEDEKREVNGDVY
jgi:hypothetical protein